MTTKFSRFLLTTCLALIGFSTNVAMADEWNKETIFKFTEPVQIPGKVLQPGTYSFRLADSSSNRNIVEVFAVDEQGRQKFVKMLETVPDFILKLADKPVIQFEERRLGDPEAIKSYFYPGDHYGWHFVYPKSEQLEAASVAPPPAPLAPAVEPVIAQPPAATPEAEPVLVVERETFISQVALAPESSEDVPASAGRVLPETAGNSAALLLAGIVTFGAGLSAVCLSLRRAQPQAN